MNKAKINNIKVEIYPAILFINYVIHIIKSEINPKLNNFLTLTLLFQMIYDKIKTRDVIILNFHTVKTKTLYLNKYLYPKEL